MSTVYRRAALLGLCLAAGLSARATYHELGAQVRYNLTEQKNVDAEVLSRSNVSTNLVFLYQGPITSGSGLFSDLRLNAATLNDTLSQTDNTTVVLNLYRTKPDYTFIGRFTRNDASSTSNLQPLTAEMVTTNYAANLLLRRPRYPLLNLQYQYQTADSRYAGTTSGYADSSWRASAQYNLAPFYTTYDRSMQYMRSASNQLVSAMTERAAVTAVKSLGSGAEMTGEYNRYFTSSSGGGATASHNGLLRLTVTPTRALTGNVEYAVQTAERIVGARRDPTDSHTLSVGTRAELLRGLALEYTGYWLGQQSRIAAVRQEAGTVNQSLGLTSRLGEDAQLNITGTRSEDTVNGARTNRDDAVQGALQMSLGSSSDLSWSLGNTNSRSDGRSSSTYAGVSLRNRRSNRATVGVGYHWMTSHSTDGDGARSSLITNGVNADLLWMLTAKAVLDLRLGYLLSRGAATSQQLTPSANFRWQVNPKTNLGISYDVNRSDRWNDPVGPQPGVQNTNVHIHLLRSYRRGSNFTVDYLLTRANTGVVEWQRQLSTSITMKF